MRRGRGERIARWLLRLHPRWYRLRHGRDVEADLARASREGAGGGRLVRDAAQTLWWTWRDEVGRKWGRVQHPIERGRSSSMAELRQDVRYALRVLRRAPGFALVVVLTLALGIGANTALFSVVRAVLMAPLPYADADRVVMIWSRWPGFDKTWVSEPEYHNYQENLRSFDDLALFQRFEVSVTEDDSPERVTATAIMPSLLPILGVQPILGRNFRPEEAEGTGADVALLSYETWQRRFGGDPGVIGQTLNTNGTDQEIVGVLPADFRLPIDFATDRPTQLWFPYALTSPPGPLPQSGGSHSSYAVGRLRDGVSVEAANAEMRAYLAPLNENGTYPPDWNFQALIVTAVDEVAGSMRPALLILLGAVGFVLLIACVNVANLLLVRGEDRRREVGVRAALGAGRSRLVRQLLAENVVLALAGGVVGAGLAGGGIALLRALAPADLPRIPDATIDAGVLGFTLLLCLITAGLFGLLPALQVARADVQTVLRESGRANTAARGRTRIRRLLVAGEVALAVMLAVGAGLMLKSFWRMVQLDPGFRTENVLTMRLAVPGAFYPEDADVTRFYSELLAGVRALQGVQHAGIVRLLPIDQVIGDSCVQIEGYTPPPGQCAPADWQAASDGYFEAMGIPVVEGRSIEPGDTREAAQVMVVNQEFVRRYIPDGVALGRRVRFAFNGEFPDQVIVGVVGDSRHNGITGEIKATFYRPHAQWSQSTGFPQRSVALVVRTNAEALAIAPAIQAQVRALDARLPISSVQTMETVVSRAVAQPRFTLMLLLAFGGLALLLAVVGIYGVVAYTVTARRQELGIRMALGAAPLAVVWLALRSGLAWAASGVVAGTIGALAATRLMQNLVYETPTTDPLTYVAVAALGMIAAFGASCVPALRASRTDPLEALRAE